jgi:hypothetical protein
MSSQKQIRIGARLASFAIVAAVVGCARADGSQGDTSGSRSRQDTFVYTDGGRATSRVERSSDPDGAESLCGVTEIVAADGTRTAIREEARLDRTGRLAWASIAGAGAHAADRVVLDVARGLVRLETGGSAVEWRVPTDEPWVYPAVHDRAGERLVTPIGAWITSRAARAGADVRVLYPEARRSQVVPADQVAIPTELGTTVILGDDSAEIGTAFVDRVRLAGLDRTLALAEPAGVLALPCR